MKYIIVDLSKFNGSINAKQLKESVDGVIIRIGYRGYGKSGNIVPDLMFDNYTKACVEAGIEQIAFYFFPTSITVEEAKEEAEYAYAMASKYVEKPLIYADSEMASANKDGRSDRLSKEARTKYTKAFCDRIIELGGRTGVYASDSWFKDRLDLTQLMNYSLWVAKYSSTSPIYVTSYDGWQYTSKAKVNGIAKTANDLSIFSKNLNEIDNSTTKIKSPYPEPCRLLKKTFPCMRGDDVKWVQFELGFTGSDLDGIFGNYTLSKVKEYQKNHGLVVDGIVGSATRYAMKND